MTSPPPDPPADAPPRERGGLAQSASVVAAGTLVSRVLGLARESVLAACFPKEVTDLWIFAFRIPNTLRGLFAEGAANAAFVPVYAEVRAQQGEQQAKELYAKATGSLLAVLAVLSVVGIVAAPLIMVMAASGLTEDRARFADAVALERIVFPYIFFMGAAALAAGALNAHRSFAVPALAPAVVNIALIAAPFVLVPVALALGLPAIGALALGALIGGALQVIVQWPALARSGLWQRPRIDFRDPGIRKAIALLGPVTAGLGVYQLNVLLSGTLASYLSEGSQTYLWYGQRLVEIPQGMFAIAIATVALPRLADLRARGEVDALKQTVREALRTMLFVAIPASALMIVLAEPIVATLFQRGPFGRAETLETAGSLAWQAAGVWAIASVRVVVPVFHAHRDTRTPVLASAVNLVVFGGVGIALSQGPMRHEGIALAISAAGAVQLAVLVALLRRKIGALGLGEVVASAARIALASSAMAGAAWSVARLGRWEDGVDLVDVAVLAGAVVAGGVVYLGAAAVLRAPELDGVLGAVRRRLRRR
jgi:putative peptidoglycan lipid II flippase